MGDPEITFLPPVSHTEDSVSPPPEGSPPPQHARNTHPKFTFVVFFFFRKTAYPKGCKIENLQKRASLQLSKKQFFRKRELLQSVKGFGERFISVQQDFSRRPSHVDRR